MILSTLIAIAPAVVSLDARIVAVSMFKNGYAVVTRQLDVPGPGDYSLDSLPASTLGTLWFSSSEGTKVDAIETVSLTTPAKFPYTDLDQILNGNVGKVVSLGLKTTDSVAGTSASGKLLSSSSEMVVLSTDHGTIALPESSVSSVSSPSGDLKLASENQVTSHGLRFSISGRSGHISMVSLERGITWAPGYAVDLKDKKTLLLTAKSTVLDDLADLKNVDARFVTGFPNVEFAGTDDPLSSTEPIDQFIASLAQTDRMTQVSSSIGVASGLVNQNTRATIDAESGRSGAPVALVRAPGEQVEDLFFYHQPDLSLERNQRAYFVLFQAEVPYKEVYTWDTSDGGSFDSSPGNSMYGSLTDDVWHTLAFKNTTEGRSPPRPPRPSRTVRSSVRTL